MNGHIVIKNSAAGTCNRINLNHLKRPVGEIGHVPSQGIVHFPLEFRRGLCGTLFDGQHAGVHAVGIALRIRILRDQFNARPRRPSRTRLIVKPFSRRKEHEDQMATTMMS